MAPKENIFPSAKSIVGIIKHILIESEDELEDPELLSDVDEMEELEQLSDFDGDSDDDLEAGDMEQIELLSDVDSETPTIYHHLLCFEGMGQVTPSSSSDGLVFDAARGVFHIRRRLFPSDASDTDSSDEFD